MQVVNETPRNFLERTDSLASHLEINVQDLPDVIGIGRASLFCYRTGKRPITSKAWSKLAKAEKRAGLSTSIPKEGSHEVPSLQTHDLTLAEAQDYTRRTDTLATSLRVKVQDLPDVVGISRATLFAYRSGKRHINGRAWSKLEAAEREAGLRALQPLDSDVKTHAPPDAEAISAKFAEFDQRLDRIESLLKGLLDQLQESQERESQVPHSRSERKSA